MIVGVGECICRLADNVHARARVQRGAPHRAQAPYESVMIRFTATMPARCPPEAAPSYGALYFAVPTPMNGIGAPA